MAWRRWRDQGPIAAVEIQGLCAVRQRGIIDGQDLVFEAGGGL